MYCKLFKNRLFYPLFVCYLFYANENQLIKSPLMSVLCLCYAKHLKLVNTRVPSQLGYCLRRLFPQWGKSRSFTNQLQCDQAASFSTASMGVNTAVNPIVFSRRTAETHAVSFPDGEEIKWCIYIMTSAVCTSHWLHCSSSHFPYRSVIEILGADYCRWLYIPDIMCTRWGQKL